MSVLRKQPTAISGKVHAITPADAHWDYVGFSLYRLAPNDEASENTASTEVILVWVEGRGTIEVDGVDYGELGERLDVFEKLAPHTIYIPPGANWSVRATTSLTLAVCSAPSGGGRAVTLIDPQSITLTQRGLGTNTRYINNIAMEDRDIADRLLVTEVYTPSGHWSSYPPHRHDEDRYPEITYLEETYYHRLNPMHGYGYQRVFTEDGSLDENIALANHDVVLVPRGHHPCGVPYGYEMYYLNVMAGPLRKWRFINHPDHDWIYQRDCD